jgi:hypothetical protein
VRTVVRKDLPRHAGRSFDPRLIGKTGHDVVARGPIALDEISHLRAERRGDDN